MAERNVRFLIKKKNTSGGSLPTSALMGEPFINIYDGILSFSGTSGGVFETSQQNGVFEVGSRLYNQKVLNRFSVNDNFIVSGDTGIISKYGGTTSLAGKFLSGTSIGMVLANISDISSKPAGSNGQVQFNSGGTVFGSSSDFVFDISENKLIISNIEGASISGSNLYSGSTELGSLFAEIAHTHNISEVPGLQNSLDGKSNTGHTHTISEINTLSTHLGNKANLSGATFTGNIYVPSITGVTLYSGTTELSQVMNNMLGTIDATYVQPGVNIITGGTAVKPIVSVASSPVFTGLITASGLTDTSLTAGRMLIAGTGGRIVDDADIFFNSGTNTLTSYNLSTHGSGSLGVGTGGVIIGAAGSGDLVVHGNLYVYGTTLSAHTSDLYIEDSNLVLNYNPTGSTASSSLGAGLVIQDGLGITSEDVLFDVRGTGTGTANRSWTTNLEDIRIRETGTVNAPNGKRVIAEEDTLDGGSY